MKIDELTIDDIASAGGLCVGSVVPVRAFDSARIQILIEEVERLRSKVKRLEADIKQYKETK